MKKRWRQDDRKKKPKKSSNKHKRRPSGEPDKPQRQQLSKQHSKSSNYLTSRG